MSMQLKQQVKLLQQLRMTPQLQQAIKLLQLSRLELAELISQEMVENVVLEEVVHEPHEDGNQIEANTSAQGELDAAPQQSTLEQAAEMGEVTNETPKAEDLAAWEAYIESSSTPLPSNSSRGMNEDLPSLEATLSKSEDLNDHLMWQMRLSNFAEQEQLVATVIIGNLNENGYFTGTTLEEIVDGTDCSLDYAEEVLELIQEFDPIGVGARDLRECLLIQARHFYEGNDLLLALIDRHIPNLEKKRYDLIARELKIDFNRVIELAKIVSQMEPKPGRSFTSHQPQYITPDIHIIKSSSGFVSIINDDGIPKLKISNFYRDALARGEVPGAKKYIQEKVKNAAWLIQSIYRRQETIKKVTDSIIKFQYAFLEHGISNLKPLVLRDVAEDIGMHESTISRVTTNKYVHTPQGIFELKYFFNSSISKVHGEDIASEAVKNKIKQIVEGEKPEKPFSDAAIVRLLREEHNIDIARRTVAKYRDVLGILSSTKRKRLF